MRLKIEIDTRLVHPAIWMYLGVIAAEHRLWTREPLVVTELRRPPTDRPSRHAPKEDEEVTAADFRRHVLDTLHAADAFCRMIQARWGDELAVVLEPEWLTPEELSERGGVLRVDPHVHVQLRTPDYPGI